jgi:hypothetical protein
MTHTPGLLFVEDRTLDRAAASQGAEVCWRRGEGWRASHARLALQAEGLLVAAQHPQTEQGRQGSWTWRQQREAEGGGPPPPGEHGHAEAPPP